jgi:general secretion pathway protein G
MELLVVVVIIGLLAGMLMTAVTKARRKATVAKATSTISALEGAISMYESDLGDYPASGNQNLVNALADINITNTSWDGPYMQFKAQELKGAIPNAELLDPWGNPYVYTQPGTHNLRSYDLYSFGPNGTDEQGVGDDIHNW